MAFVKNPAQPGQSGSVRIGTSGCAGRVVGVVLRGTARASSERVGVMRPARSSERSIAAASRSSAMRGGRCTASSTITVDGSSVMQPAQSATPQLRQVCRAAAPPANCTLHSMQRGARNGGT